MLTFSSKKLLKKLKTINKPVIVKLDKFNNIISFTSSNNLKEDCIEEICFYHSTIIDEKLVYTFTYDTFDYLLDNNYIKLEDKQVTVTHVGYHEFQIQLKKFCNFCFRSIFVPIVISLITTLLYNYFIK